MCALAMQFFLVQTAVFLYLRKSIFSEVQRLTTLHQDPANRLRGNDVRKYTEWTLNSTLNPQWTILQYWYRDASYWMKIQRTIITCNELTTIVFLAKFWNRHFIAIIFTALWLLSDWIFVIVNQDYWMRAKHEWKCRVQYVSMQQVRTVVASRLSPRKWYSLLAEHSQTYQKEDRPGFLSVFAFPLNYEIHIWRFHTNEIPIWPSLSIR